MSINLKRAENIHNLRPLSNRHIPLSFDFIRILAFSIDALIVFLSFLFFEKVLHPPQVNWSELLAVATMTIIFTTFLLYVRRFYQQAIIMAPHNHMVSLSGLLIIAFISVYMALKGLSVWFFANSQEAMQFFIVMAPAFLAGRFVTLLIVSILVTAGVTQRRIAIVGAGERAQNLLLKLRKQDRGFLAVVGIFDDQSGHEESLPPDGSIEDLLTLIRQTSIDDVILAVPASADEKILRTLTALREMPVQVHIVSDMVNSYFAGLLSLEQYYGLPMLRVENNPLRGWRAFLKLVEDKVLAVIALILFGPIMLLVALAIRLESPGPIIFRQPRMGFNNSRFDVFKFRSMYHQTSAPQTIEALQTTKSDKRVTRVGRFIRRTSLDELPQLFNVINGSMSMVGPRPHAVDHNREFAAKLDGYLARHKVRPGITGWAQVNGLRGPTNTLEQMDFRVRYDMYYIENWSLIFDLEILVLTVFFGFIGKRAY